MHQEACHHCRNRQFEHGYATCPLNNRVGAREVGLGRARKIWGIFTRPLWQESPGDFPPTCLPLMRSHEQTYPCERGMPASPRWETGKRL